MCDYHMQLNHVQCLFYIITYNGVMINYIVSFLGQDIYFTLRYLELWSIVKDVGAGSFFLS